MAVTERQSEQNAGYTPELVVVLEHRPEVLRVLGEWNIHFEPPTNGNKDLYESQDLGLALILLVNDIEAGRSAVAGLKRAAAEDATVAAMVNKAAGIAGAAATGNATIDAHQESLTPGMDQLLWALRTYFAAKNEGWIPTLGKNRLVGDVEDGNGHVSHREIKFPKPSAWRPEQEARPTELGRGVRVGVLDTSISRHPWLVDGLVSPDKDFLEPRLEYPAEAGHGTFVAGLIKQRAPGCEIQFRKGLSDEDGTATSWDVAKKIVELGRTGLDVLNLSLGCYTKDGQPPLVLATAIDRLDPEIEVVAAAGNHGDLEAKAGDADHPAITAGDRRKPSWPAALDDVIAVGAGDDERRRAPFTPDNVLWIDVLSNGVDVSSTYLEGPVNVTNTPGKHEPETFEGYAMGSGTSFSAALVSGEIAARTVPSERSAHQAWQSILEELEGEQPGVRPAFLWLV